jgi:hypothetical protein
MEGVSDRLEQRSGVELRGLERMLLSTFQVVRNALVRTRMTLT